MKLNKRINKQLKFRKVCILIKKADKVYIERDGEYPYIATLIEVRNLPDGAGKKRVQIYIETSDGFAGTDYFLFDADDMYYVSDLGGNIRILQPCGLRYEVSLFKHINLWKK